MVQARVSDHTFIGSGCGMFVASSSIVLVRELEYEYSSRVDVPQAPPSPAEGVGPGDEARLYMYVYICIAILSHMSSGYPYPCIGLAHRKGERSLFLILY